MIKDRREKGFEVFIFIIMFYVRMISWKLEVKILFILVLKEMSNEIYEG